MTKNPVLPVFINQSPNKTWKGALDFHSFLNNFEGELKKRFKENVLNFRLRVLNIQALDIDKTKGLTTHPILYILKHIWNLDATKIKELFTIGRGLSPREREALIVRAVDYIRQYDPAFSWKIIREIEQTTLEEEERVMAPLLQYSLDEAREEGLQKGRQEGMEKGMQAVALNMLKEKADLTFISKVTGLSEADLEKLKNRSEKI